MAVEDVETIYETIINMGIHLTRVHANQEQDYLGRTDPPKKTNKQRQIEEERLNVIAELLDRLNWRGPWGLNATAARMELRRRAGIPCATGPCDLDVCPCNGGKGYVEE